MNSVEEAGAHDVLYAPQWLGSDQCLRLIERCSVESMRNRSYQGVVNVQLRNCQYAVLPEETTEIFLRFARERLEPFFGTVVNSNLPFSPVIYRYQIGRAHV